MDKLSAFMFAFQNKVIQQSSMCSMSPPLEPLNSRVVLYSVLAANIDPACLSDDPRLLAEDVEDFFEAMPAASEIGDGELPPWYLPISGVVIPPRRVEEPAPVPTDSGGWMVGHAANTAPESSIVIGGVSTPVPTVVPRRLTCPVCVGHGCDACSNTGFITN